MKCYSCGENKKALKKCSCGEIVCEWCSLVGGHNGYFGHMGYEAHARLLITKRETITDALNRPHCCRSYVLTGVHHVKCKKAVTT